MSGPASAAARSSVLARTARAGDLPGVLALVRQHLADTAFECALTGQGPGTAAAAGFRRLLADPGHRVVLAVVPGPGAHDGLAGGELVVGLAVLGADPLAAVLGNPQVTVDWFVVHRDHRRRGAGAALLSAAAGYARDVGAEHVVTAVGGQDTERQRFFARMGFAPLSTRRIAGREQLDRQLTAWRRGRLLQPGQRRHLPRRRSASAPTPVGDLGSTAEG